MTKNQNRAQPKAGSKRKPVTGRQALASTWAKPIFPRILLLGRLPLGACLLLLLSFHYRSSGQNYSIDWHQVSGGGGTSSGGPYSVSGTVGQPEAGGVLTGGVYSLAGGFWALYAAQTPGAPALHLLLSSTNTAVLWWPSPSVGWTLQQSSILATTNWTSATEAVNDNGKTKSIVVKPLAGNRFYRLANP